MSLINKLKNNFISEIKVECHIYLKVEIYAILLSSFHTYQYYVF